MTKASGAPPSRSCPSCAASCEIDQEYCLECGERLPPRWRRGRRLFSSWLSIAAATLGVAVIALAGALAAVAVTRDEQKPEARAPVILTTTERLVVTAPGAPAPPALPTNASVTDIDTAVTDVDAATELPPTITLGPPEPSPAPDGTTFTDTFPTFTDTDGLTDTGLPTTDVLPSTDVTTTTETETLPTIGTFTDTDTVGTSRTDSVSDDVIDWPSAEDGYAIVLASVSLGDGRARAEEIAEQALDEGLVDVGILESSDYSSLRPGYYVVFSGVYDSLAEAQADLPEARSSGFALAYPREIAE